MSSVNFAIPEPCLIHPTMRVRTATCAGARAATVAAPLVPEECGLPLEPVLDCVMLSFSTLPLMTLI
jgi:hypothetical protein